MFTCKFFFAILPPSIWLFEKYLCDEKLLLTPTLVAVRGKESYSFAYNINRNFSFTGLFMTVIRLTRMGRKKKPFYRIAVTDSRKRRDGGWIELIGYYNPMTKELKVDDERVDYWLSVGAQMSDRVKKITGR